MGVKAMTGERIERYGQEAIERTRKYMRGYYGKEISPRDIAKDISIQGFSWIGASTGECFPDGQKGILFFCHQWDYQHVPRIYMDRDTYSVQTLGESVFLVCMQCRLRTDPSSKLVLSEVQRGTFVYHLEDGALKLAHIHVSNEWQVRERYEKFADTRGRANYEYLQQLLAERKLGMVEKLSIRQREVLNLLCQGYTYKEIGEIMDISPRTVRYHVNEMLIKFHAANKNQLISMVSGMQEEAGFQEE